MKRKRLALLLAAALTVTSVDGTAFVVSGADFSSEPAEEAQAEEAAVVDENSLDAADDFSSEADGTVEETSAPDQEEAAQPEGEAEEPAQPDELTQDDSSESGDTAELSAPDSENTDAVNAGEVSEFSDEAADGAAVEAADSIIPSTVQELTPDTSYDVNLDEERKDAWFSFTAPEDGTYMFYSKGDEDTYAYVYDRPDVTSKGDCLDSDDDSGENTNFKLNVAMTKGTTYYFCAKLLSEGDTGTFTVKLEKVPTVSSVKLNTSKLEKTEFIPSIDDCCLAGLELTAQYESGKESETLTFSDYETVTDEYGNTFSYKFKSASGEDQTVYDAGCTMSDGTWNAVFYCNGNPITTDTTCSIQVKKPANLPVLLTGTENPITSRDYTFNWYLFTAPETAQYRISPVASFAVYKESGYDYVPYSMNDDGAVISVEKGETYYLGFKGYRYDDNDDRVNQWAVNFEKKASVSSITLNNKELTFISGVGSQIDRYTSAGTITVSYSDGSAPYSVNVSLGGYSYDKFGNYITSKLIDSNGKQVSWYDEDEGEGYLQNGTYKLTYTISDGDNEITTDEIPVTVQKPAFDNFPKLVYGENKVKTISYDDEAEPTYYAFEAEKDGEYAFDYDHDRYDLSAQWYRFDDNGDLKKINPKYRYAGWELSKGKYIVTWYDYNVCNSATINVKYIPSITSVKVKSWKSYDTVVSEKTGNAFLKELVVEVTYDDGTTKELSYNSDNSSDEYGRDLFYTFTHSKNENGEYPEVKEPYNLTAGDYVYRIAVGGVYADDIPFKVVSRDEAVTKELTTGSNEMKNQEGLLLKYKAPAKGRYELAVNIPVTELRIRKADETELEDISVTDYRAYASFEKDETYYIYVRADEYCPELKVTVSALTRPESMETTALKKTYIAGIDYFNETDMQTKVSFDGQKTRTIRGRDYVEGYQLQYRVENSEGEQYDTTAPLTAGNWTVTPYLSASFQTGSAIAVDMSRLPVKSDTITAKKFDLSTLTALKEDSWTEIESNARNAEYYVFTASKDGTYLAENDDDYGYGYASFYADEKSGYSYSGDEITLKKGESCLVAISADTDVRFRIVKAGSTPTVTPKPTETPEKVTDIALTDGMEKAVSYEKKDIRCTFTPAQDGYYVLESASLDGEFVDTWADLYCGNDFVTTDDESGDNGNFRLAWKLEKGKTYTYLVRIYGGTAGDFKLSFNKLNVKKVKDIQLVKRSEDEGYIPGYSDTVLSYVGDGYDLKLIYEDNTSETVEHLWNTNDRYENNIHVQVDSEDDAAGNTVTLMISVTCGFPWENSDQIFKKTFEVSQKGFAALNQLQAGKEQQLKASDEYYCFTPSETGKYIITSKEPESGFSYLSMSECGKKLVNGYLDLSELEKRYEGKGAYAVSLKAGKTYYVHVDRSKDAGTGSVCIQKVNKTLKGLELAKAPEQTSCLPNDTNYVSLKGLQVKALYTDGSTENITYGEADSCGRQICRSEIKWNANGKATVYVNLEDYQTSFEVSAASWNQVQVLKAGQTASLKAENGDILTLKFVPEKNGYYNINVNGGYANRLVVAENPDDNAYLNGRCLMKAGKTYYIHVQVFQSNPEVAVYFGSCKNNEHTWDNGKVTKAATCKEEGIKTYTCSACGATRTEVIAKTTDHKWDNGKVTKAATCKEAGVKTYTCSVCGTTKTEAIAKTTNHKWDNGKITKAATCKEAGVKTYTCNVCGAIRTEAIAKTTDHKWDNGKVTKAATCKEAGVKTYTCSVCGATKTEAIAKTNDHKWDNGKVTKAATCKEAGVKTYTCSVCGATRTEVIAKTTDHKWDNGKVTKEATCKEAGVKTYTCSVCGATRTESIAKTTDHKWDNGKVTKAATCKEAGVKTYTCSVCGATKTEAIAKTTDHKWDNGKVTKEATCKEEGVKTYTCSVCGATKTEAIAKITEHKWDNGKVTKAATCKEEGVKTYTCSVCGATKTETIAKTGHKFGKWFKITDASIKAKQKQKRVCAVCKKAEYRYVGKTLTPTIKLNIRSLTLQQRQTTKAVKVTMARGDSVRFWVSNNKRVATVDKNGVIKAQKKNGTAKITVTLKSGKKATVTVKVQSKKITTSKITGLKSKVTLKKGKTLALKPVLSPVTSQDKITYATSNKSVATVNSRGVITAKKNGTARITVKSGKKSYVINVTVTK